MRDPIRDALIRLSASLDRLDATSLRHVEAERIRATLETELAVMREDRQTLAALLDDERAWRHDAETGLIALQPRVEKAIEAVRQALREG
jgi:Domain of unknown function (DUF4164)